MLCLINTPNPKKNRNRFLLERWNLLSIYDRIGQELSLGGWSLPDKGGDALGNVVGIINILPGYCWDSLLVSKQEIKKDRPHWPA